jgi:hypothetical protein
VQVEAVVTEQPPAVCPAAVEQVAVAKAKQHMSLPKTKRRARPSVVWLAFARAGAPPAEMQSRRGRKEGNRPMYVSGNNAWRHQPNDGSHAPTPPTTVTHYSNRQRHRAPHPTHAPSCHPTRMQAARRDRAAGNMAPFILFAFLALYAGRAIAKPWSPVPPCAAPLGVAVPAVPESMCSHPVAQVGDVTIRDYGLPAAATLVEVHIDGSVFYQVLADGIQMLLQYFSGDNAGSKNVLDARTTPIVVRNVGDYNLTWIVSMMISTAAFPDPSAIPLPNLPVELEQVGRRSLAVLQFNTTSLPVEADFEAACGQLFASPLPKGYTFNRSSSYSPSYVLYSGETTSLFTNECWAEVVRR